MPNTWRCAWIVTAGIIPGEPMPEYTRQWGMTSAEWEAPGNVALFNACLVAALEYARYLSDPYLLNWTNVHWIWY